MHTQQMQSAAQERPVYHFIVSAEEAERNQQIEAARKMAAKEAKLASAAYAEALRLDRARDHERALAESAPVAIVAPQKAVILHTPTPEEVEALRADIARREDLRLRGIRRGAAEKTKKDLLRWAEKTQPAISRFVREVIGALFVHVRDERNAAVYACEGVEIRAYGAVVEQKMPTVRRQGNRLNAEQQRAADRRRGGAKHAAPKAPAQAVTVKVVEQTPEERAEQKAKNVAEAAALKAAKDAKQRAFKLAHPKTKKAPVAKAKKDNGKKSKGGK